LLTAVISSFVPGVRSFLKFKYLLGPALAAIILASVSCMPAANTTARSVPTPRVLSTTAATGAVTITSPTTATTTSSPVRFLASATAPTGRIINLMRIYVDGTSAYTTNASSISTSLLVNAGYHKVTVQARDSSGSTYVKSINMTVASSTSGSSTSSSSTSSSSTSNSSTSGSSTSSSQHLTNFHAASKWVSQFSRSTGAIMYTPSVINPYYSNLAAIGMTKDATRMPQVVAWMHWYIDHLNWPDKWGLYGTTYDYKIINGIEVATQNADSTDSYAATFLTLAWNAWKSGDATARSYILGLSSQLEGIGGVILNTQQSDGLTWAKPDYKIKYLMDNCEAYRGLRDLASLYQNAFNDATRAAHFNAAADSMLKGILGMWLNGKWAVYKNYYGNLIAPHLGTWYPDASSQIFPVLTGVVSSSDLRAQQSYAAFNAAWPAWDSLSFNSQDPFPWSLVGDAAAAMGDSARLAKYISTIQSKYVNAGFPWPFYIAEAGWFMRANNYMLGLGL
jgi:hypothetical protein